MLINLCCRQGMFKTLGAVKMMPPPFELRQKMAEGQSRVAQILKTTAPLPHTGKGPLTKKTTSRGKLSCMSSQFCAPKRIPVSICIVCKAGSFGAAPCTTASMTRLVTAARKVGSAPISSVSSARLKDSQRLVTQTSAVKILGVSFW